MKISKNFVEEELYISRNYPELSEKPDKQKLDILKSIVIISLQPIRDQFGEIIITSGYRNDELNKKVKGCRNSVHKKALALDFTFTNKIISLFDIFRWIYVYIPWKCLIYYPKRKFIHMDFAIWRQKIAYISGKKGEYIKWKKRP